MNTTTSSQMVKRVRHAQRSDILQTERSNHETKKTRSRDRSADQCQIQ